MAASLEPVESRRRAGASRHGVRVHVFEFTITTTTLSNKFTDARIARITLVRNYPFPRTRIILQLIALFRVVDFGIFEKGVK